jgi:hypothetical protein
MPSWVYVCLRVLTAEWRRFVLPVNETQLSGSSDSPGNHELNQPAFHLVTALSLANSLLGEQHLASVFES